MPEFLAFSLNEQRYALPAAGVVEVQRAVAIAPLPRSPAVVEGIINLRGKLVPVLDVRARLGLPAAPLVPSNHLIIVRLGQAGAGHGRTVAIRVDCAHDLFRAPDALIEDPRPAAGPSRARGVAKLPDGLVVLEDLGTFLSLDEELQIEESLAGTAS